MGDEGKRSPLILDLDNLIADVLGHRRLARQGTALALAQQEAEEPDVDRLATFRESARRARNHWNAATLVAIFGAIDSFIRTMGSDLRPLVIETNPDKRQQIFEGNRMRNRMLKDAGTITVDAVKVLNALMKKVAEELLKPPLKAPPKGLPAADGWEELLKRVHLRPAPGRPLPEDLRLALNEIGEVRNVVLHRMGRMDEKALQQVTFGPWRQVDQLVEIDDDLYRTYIASLISYHREIVGRVQIRLGVPAMFDISQWRSMVPVGD